MLSLSTIPLRLEQVPAHLAVAVVFAERVSQYTLLQEGDNGSCVVRFSSAARANACMNMSMRTLDAGKGTKVEFEFEDTMSIHLLVQDDGRITHCVVRCCPAVLDHGAFVPSEDRRQRNFEVIPEKMQAFQQELEKHAIKHAS